MGITDKMWDALTTVIKMNDNIERMAGTMKGQQEKIENLTERVIRLETALEIARSHPVPPGLTRPDRKISFNNQRRVGSWLGNMWIPTSECTCPGVFDGKQHPR